MVIRPIKRLFNFIIKVIQYMPILWRDYDFDSHYALVLLKYKLERTRKKILKDNIIVGTNRVARQIRLAELLLERILVDNYCVKEHQELDERWGEYTRSDEFIFPMIRAKVKTDKDKEQSNGELLAIMNKEHYMRKQDMRYLFDHMNKKIDSWWD